MKATLTCLHFGSRLPLGLLLLPVLALSAELSVPVPNPDAVAQPPTQYRLPTLGLSPGVSMNTRCNSRTTCKDGRGVTQSETILAISGDAVVCGYNDSRGHFCPDQPPGYQLTGWAYSLNGGADFTDGGPLPGGTMHSGDPWLATGPDGTIYYTDIWTEIGAMALLRGTVTKQGIVWSDPTVALSSGYFDKEAMAVDQLSGTIYITYDRSPSGVTWLKRSFDGGLSLDVGVPTGLSGIASYPAVGPNGELYVVSSGSEVRFTRSLDGGDSFAPSRAIGRTISFPVPGMTRHLQFPQMAVDTSGGPNNGNIYVVWETQISGNGNVVYVWSADGGDSWSATQLVNEDTPGLHFYPTVSVDALGRINVFFYDRRDNPDTRITHLYFARSIDGGLSFGPNIRVTDTASLWDSAEVTPNFGDYIGSVSVGTRACVAYTDARDGDPDAYFACVDL